MRKEQNMATEMTNAKFAKEDKNFINACNHVKMVLGVEVNPTTRQASKYRNKKGLAYKVGKPGIDLEKTV